MGRRVHYATAAIGLVVVGVGGAVPFALVPNASVSGTFALVTSSVMNPWSDDQPESILSPAEVIAMRFPDEPDETPVTTTDDRAKLAEAVETEPTGASEDHILFSPYLTYDPTVSKPVTTHMESEPAAAPAPTPAPLVSKPAVVAIAHRAIRPDAVFNDAQIAMIKKRLSLRPEQEYMWPAVEAALRKLSYAKAAHKPGIDITRVAAIDPRNADVQNLSDAATPLVMSFSSDQRQQLLSIAHIAGLESLIPKF